MIPHQRGPKKMTKRELNALIRELSDAVKDLRSAVKANDWEFASLTMDDVEGIGAQVREEVNARASR